MYQLSKQLREEYDLIEKQLDKVSKVILTIDENTNLLEHEVMELSVLLENLGLSLNELEDKHGTIN